jgi:hypothetical protein
MNAGDLMKLTETLHAAHETGENISPCCGRTLDELPRYDRIAPKPEQVTCGRLTVEEITLLSGQPVIIDPYDRQVLFMMASTVCRLVGDGVSTAEVNARIDEAIRQVIPHDRPLLSWTPELMVRVTTRAEELIHF